jgi:hypothetical protein
MTTITRGTATTTTTAGTTGGGATPELDSLPLFGAGLSGMGGYVVSPTPTVARA